MSGSRKVLLMVDGLVVAAPFRNQMTLDLASVIKSNGHEVHVLLGSADYSQDFEERAKKLDIKIDVLVQPKILGVGFFQYLINVFAYHKKLFRFFRMYEFHLVHAFGWYASILSIFLKIRFNVPTLWHLIQVPFSGRKLYFFKWAASTFADHIVSVSNMVSHLFGRTKYWYNRISIIYHSAEDTSEEQENLEKYSLKSDKASTIAPVITLICDESSSYDVLSFRTAMKSVWEKKPTAQALVLCFTENEDVEGIRTQVHSTMGTDSGNIIVEVIRISDWDQFKFGLEQSRVSVAVFAATRPEVFSLSLLRVARLGIPIVVTNQGFYSEVITNAETGFAFPVANAEELAKALNILILKPEHAKAMQERLKKESQARFGNKLLKSKISAVYQPILDIDSEKESETELNSNVQDKKKAA